MLLNEKNHWYETILFGEQITIRIFFEVNTPLLPRSAMGVGITDAHGTEIIHFNSIDRELRLRIWCPDNISLTLPSSRGWLPANTPFGVE